MGTFSDAGAVPAGSTDVSREPASAAVAEAAPSRPGNPVLGGPRPGADSVAAMSPSRNAVTAGVGGAGADTMLRCAECGERIAPGRPPGTFVHASRVVAACDLDSDHMPVPSDRARATSKGET